MRKQVWGVYCYCPKCEAVLRWPWHPEKWNDRWRLPFHCYLCLEIDRKTIQMVRRAAERQPKVYGPIWRKMVADLRNQEPRS